MGGKIAEISISAPKRKKGESKYGIGRTIDVLMDILMLWFESTSRSRPIYSLGRISIGIFSIAFLIIIWLMLEKILYGFPVSNRPPFFMAILFFIVSFLIFFQALVLEFLSSIYKKMTGNKDYILYNGNSKKKI